MEYSPGRWKVIKLTNPNKEIHYRVFGTWGGSYLHGQSWRINSGIDRVTEDENNYYFEGYSGSIYICHKKTYGFFGYGLSILSQMMEDSKPLGIIMEIMPEDTNWLELDYHPPVDVTT